MRRRSNIVRTILGCGAVVAALSVPSARAQVTEGSFLVRSTGDLVGLCASQQADRLYTAAQNFCHGYVVGVYQTLEAQQAAQRTKLFCPPAQMPTRTEAVANFVQWAQAVPARLATAPAEGIAAYVAERAPCPPGRARN